MKVVFTNGCFDLFHAGHLHLLERAKSFGDYLIVGINSDYSIKKLKKNRPIICEDDRLNIVRSLKVVDKACLFDGDTPLKLIKGYCPDIIVKGGDYKEEDVVGGDFVKVYGGRVEIVPLMPRYSTTQIVEKIRRNNDC